MNPCRSFLVSKVFLPMPTARATLVLGPEDHGTIVSAADFACAEFVEPWKYEREGGRLVVMAPDGQAHNDATCPWRKRLAAYWNAHPELVEDVLPAAWVRDENGHDSIGDIGVYLVSIDPPSIPDALPISCSKSSAPEKFLEKGIMSKNARSIMRSAFGNTSSSIASPKRSSS